MRLSTLEAMLFPFAAIYLVALVSGQRAGSGHVRKLAFGPKLSYSSLP